MNGAKRHARTDSSHSGPTISSQMRRRQSSGVPMMLKRDCSVIVLSALKKQLKEVDDNGDNRVDCEEFKEALLSLKSSLLDADGAAATALFSALADAQTSEVGTARLLKDLQAMYAEQPA